MPCMWWLALVFVAGCAYTPGSYAYPGRAFPGERLRVGCLDVAIDRRADLDDRPVLDYQFGNRCDESVEIDLARLPVVGRTATGDEVALAAWDPGNEIVPAKLGARQAGGEAIAYASREAVPFAQVCVDVAVLGRAKTTAAQWVCFASARGMIAAVSP